MTSPAFITRTDISFDRAKISAAYEQYRAMDLPHTRNAVAVTSRPGAAEPLSAASAPPLADEMLHNVINAEFHGTYIEEVLKSLPFPFGRTRLMSVPPQKCYPVHADGTTRYHLVLQTHPQTYLLFPDHGQVYHMPADGYLYRMDARPPHTAVNCGPFLRTHMVIITDQQ